MPKTSARKKKYSKRSSTKKKPSNLRNILIVMVLFISSLAFLSGYLLYKDVTHELASAFSFNSRDLLSKDIFTSAMITVDDFESEPLLVRGVSLYVFDKSTLKLIIYEIPVETAIDVLGRFTQEPFSNVLAIGQMEGKDLYSSSRLLADSVFRLLAFPVDRYILVNDKSEGFVSSLFTGKFSLGESDLLMLKDELKTDHNVREFFSIYEFAKSLPADRILRKDVSPTYLENPNLIDEEFMDLTFDSFLSKEMKNIAVLNGTGQTGVANFGARVVKNFGGRVVAVGNTKQAYEESVLITDDETSESTRLLAQIFGIEKVILYSDALDFSESEINRSDLTIILGIDFTASL